MSAMLLLTVFVLAIFLGFELITKVPPTLHTPLMSGANAISGVTIVGALGCAYLDALPNDLANWLGAALFVMSLALILPPVIAQTKLFESGSSS